MVDERKVSNDIHDSKIKDPGWGYRHKQCLILFWVLSIGFSMRSCMGVSLVAMTDYNDKDQKFKPEGILNALMLIPPICAYGYTLCDKLRAVLAKFHHLNTILDRATQYTVYYALYPTLNWNKSVQNAVIASFFWGYVLLQLPAGQLAHKFGARYLLTGAMTINSVFSILLPTATYYGGWYCTAMCRVVQGLSQACIMPGLHTSLGKWAPLQERARLSALVYGGQALGTVFGLPLTGFISASFMGWPGIFRFYGVLSGVMAVLVWYFVYDTPAQHPKISVIEKKYIEDDLGTTEGKKKPPVPWLKILSHRGLYAIVFAHFGHTWGQLTLYSEVPTYMDKVMGVNLKANGLLTALPFFVMWITNFFFSWFTDWLIVKNITSVTTARKIANSLGYVPAGIGLIALAYAPPNIYIAETLLVILCAFKISANSGYQVNHIDISPNYAGTMMSISNFVSNIGASVSPIVNGFILTDVGDQYLWRQVFFLAAGFFLFTNLIYVLLGTSEKAEWNDFPELEDVEENIPMMNKTKQ